MAHSDATRKEANDSEGYNVDVMLKMCKEMHSGKERIVFVVIEKITNVICC